MTVLTLKELTSRFPHNGTVEWIGVRPSRKADVRTLDQVYVGFSGLEGDHRMKPGKRAVTLIQAEHLPVIAGLSRNGQILPEQLRRNIAISGISLLALKDRQFRIGSALLEGTGICAPCSRMEEVLGTGGYNAMRGHGGITAQVVEEGRINTGDIVTACSN